MPGSTSACQHPGFLVFLSQRLSENQRLAAMAKRRLFSLGECFDLYHGEGDGEAARTAAAAVVAAAAIPDAAEDASLRSANSKDRDCHRPHFLRRTPVARQSVRPSMVRLIEVSTAGVGRRSCGQCHILSLLYWLFCGTPLGQ